MLTMLYAKVELFHHITFILFLYSRVSSGGGGGRDGYKPNRLSKHAPAAGGRVAGVASKRVSLALPQPGFGI